MQPAAKQQPSTEGPAMMLQNSSSGRHVLVAVSGHTPSVITETLWCLRELHGVQVDEIRIITTASGLQCIRRCLLGEGGGFAAYCRDYHIQPGQISFSEKNVHVLTHGDGSALDDIRSSRDNEEAADQIYALVREWTRRHEDILYCSVAGGRKTLGIYLATALMLCGRHDDSLSHVLVAPGFETGVKDFFYPPPQPRMFQRFKGIGPDGEPIFEDVSSERTGVELAEVPFFRLREIIGGELPLHKGFTDSIAHSQLLMSYLQKPPLLQLELAGRQARLGSISFHLSRQIMAVYAFFVTHFNNCPEGGGMEQLFRKRQAIADFERRMDRLGPGERDRYEWESISSVEDFLYKIRPCISKLNRCIVSALGRNALSDRYKVRIGVSYGVTVPNFVIVDE